METELAQIVELLRQVAEDRTVPKNIREKAQKALDSLNDESNEVSVRVSKAVQLLDESSDDPNIPTYTRTQVWNIVSHLESLLR